MTRPRRSEGAMRFLRLVACVPAACAFVLLPWAPGFVAWLVWFASALVFAFLVDEILPRTGNDPGPRERWNRR